MVVVRTTLTSLIFATLISWSTGALAQTTEPSTSDERTESTEPSQPRVIEEPPQSPRHTEAREHHAAPAAEGAEQDHPIVRAKEDDWGMFFRFGGLATLLASNNTRNVNSLLVTQVGIKAVLSEKLMIPFFFGTGVRHISEDDGNDSQTDFGLDIGVGVEYHFRIWHRISPFIGGSLGFGISDPTGDSNMVIGIGIGPNLGVEYYVADRVSLAAQYLLVFQFENGQPPGSTGKLTTVQLSTLSGGAMNLNFYF